MHSSSGYFYASFQHTLMNFQSIIAGSAKRRDQCRMNVDDLIRICLHHDLRNHNQTSCQDYQIYIVRLDRFQKRLVKCFSRLILFRRDASCLDTMFFRPLQCVGVGIVTDHNGNLRVGDGSVCYAVDDRLKIGTAAGYQNCHF